MFVQANSVTNNNTWHTQIIYVRCINKSRK